MKRTTRSFLLILLVVMLAIGVLAVPASGGANEVVRVRIVDGIQGPSRR